MVRRAATVLWFLLLVMPVFLALARPVQAQQAERPHSITVVIDDTYPPYIFRDENGQLQGILKDSWTLWSQRTGIAVDLRGLDWSEAQRRFAAGEAEAIDTVFRTEARETSMIFSAPYATLDVAIFFHSDLSGIVDARSLKGFTVAVKGGDACIDWLATQGITTIKPYPSYEAMVDAIASRETLVACIDKPPALYLMYKKGVQDVLRYTRPLYSGQFHWAVPKDRPELLPLIRQGFDMITPRERQAIEERWFGSSLSDRVQSEVLREMGRYALAGMALAALLLLWNWQLRSQVARKTHRLTETLAQLEQSEERFRTIFDSVNDAIFIHDSETGRLLQVNQRMRDMYGMPDIPMDQITVDLCSSGIPPYTGAEALVGGIGRNCRGGS